MTEDWFEMEATVRSRDAEIMARMKFRVRGSCYKDASFSAFARYSFGMEYGVEM